MDNLSRTLARRDLRILDYLYHERCRLGIVKGHSALRVDWPPNKEGLHVVIKDSQSCMAIRREEYSNPVRSWRSLLDRAEVDAAKCGRGQWSIIGGTAIRTVLMQEQKEMITTRYKGKTDHDHLDHHAELCEPDPFFMKNKRECSLFYST